MKTFRDNGRTLMVVTPAKHMFRSDMVHDVITGGRCFVVDVETGVLEIYSKEVPKDIYYTFKLPSGASFRLAKDVNEAIEQITQLAFNYGWKSGIYTIERHGKVYTFLDSLDKSFDEFVRQAVKFMKRK